MGDEDDVTRRRTTRDGDGRLVFDKRDTRSSDRGAAWFEKIARPGARNEDAPDREHRVSWGAKTQVVVEVSGATVISGQFEQVVDVRYPFPTSWNLGLYAQVNCNDATPDSVQFFAQVTYGLGRASFNEVIDMGVIATRTGSKILFRGPFPAETIIVDGVWGVTPGDAVLHQNALVFGAWAAPQVWVP